MYIYIYTPDPPYGVPKWMGVGVPLSNPKTGSKHHPLEGDCIHYFTSIYIKLYIYLVGGFNPSEKY